MTSRQCKCTDWARARGVYYYNSQQEKYKFNSPYWTRTRVLNSTTSVYCILEVGSIVSDYLFVRVTLIKGVRPSICIANL